MSLPTPARTERAVRVLLVDDDEDDFRLTRAALSEIPNRRFAVDWEPDFDAAYARICRDEHDVYLIDYHLGARTGLQLIESLKRRKGSGPTILLTGQGEVQIDEAAQAAGAADYLEKSRLDSTLLERMIRYAMRQHAQETELERSVAKRTAELEAAIAALRDADRRKDEFLATLAHELRNPLAPIRNAIEIQKHVAHDPEGVERTRAMIERQVGQMVRLIDDLLDASRLSRGKLLLDRERIDLREPLTMAVETSRPAFEKAGVHLELHVPDRAIPFLGDRVRLVQIFANVLNNAAKYTPAGGRATLTVECDPAEYRVRIADTGAGIPADQLENVFALFTQIDRTLNRSENGLGIGLALVKRLVELHGGTAAIESPGLNRGCTLTVTLPRDG